MEFFSHKYIISKSHSRTNKIKIENELGKIVPKSQPKKKKKEQTLQCKITQDCKKGQIFTSIRRPSNQFCLVLNLATKKHKVKIWEKAFDNNRTGMIGLDYLSKNCSVSATSSILMLGLRRRWRWSWCRQFRIQMADVSLCCIDSIVFVMVKSSCKVKVALGSYCCCRLFLGTFPHFFSFLKDNK